MHLAAFLTLVAVGVLCAAFKRELPRSTRPGACLLGIDAYKGEQ